MRVPRGRVAGRSLPALVEQLAQVEEEVLLGGGALGELHLAPLLNKLGDVKDPHSMLP